MSADIVGYSRMMAADELATLKKLQDFTQLVLETTTGKYEAHVVKSMGDGWLIEFQSAVNATTCAMELQRKTQAVSDFELRIGVHLGDIIVEGDDVFGDGVNLAARLQQATDAGSVLVSETMYSVFDEQLRAQFTELGSQDLKNIDRTINAFVWPSPSVSETTPELPTKQDLPVIYLDEFKGAPSGGATDFQEDLQHELLRGLARRSGVKVTIAAAARGAATYSLAGRCRLRDDRVRLDLTFSRCSNGETMWAERFEGNIADADGLIDRIIYLVSAHLRVQTNEFDGVEMVTKPDAQLNIQELLKKAAHYLHKLTRQASETARTSIEHALASEPDNPMANAMLVDSYVVLVAIGELPRAEVDKDLVMEAADRAVSHGPQIDYAHRMRAQAKLWVMHDLPGAKSDLDRALQINPNYHFLQVDLAVIEICSDRIEEGIDRLEKLIQKMPREPWVPFCQSIISHGYLWSGNLEMATRYAKEAHDRAPLSKGCFLAYALAAADDQKVVSSEKFMRAISDLQVTQSLADNLPIQDSAQVKFALGRLAAAGIPK